MAKLPDFLLSCADREPDPVKQSTVRELVDQWRAPAAPLDQRDAVWDAMVLSSRAYRNVDGYQETWSR
jgi:hypothetical protein